jgi:hypothetical protein
MSKASSKKTVVIDTRTASRTECHMAFQQERQRILQDITRLHTDVQSINQNRFPDYPIEIVFDFTEDLKEFDAWTAAQKNQWNYPEEQL